MNFIIAKIDNIFIILIAFGVSFPFLTPLAHRRE